MNKILLVGTMAMLSTSCALFDKSWEEEYAYTKGTQAAIYAFPYVYNSYLRWAWSQPPEVVGTKSLPSDAINRFFHGKTLTDATYRDGGSPNNDTLYSIAWAYVKDEPLIISVPNVGNIPGTDKPRYFTFQLSGFSSDNFDYIGTRTTGNRGGHYAIAPQGWEGSLPSNVERLVDAPTPWIFILGRTLVMGPEDLSAVAELQSQYNITALSQWGKANPKRPFSPDIAEVPDLKNEPREVIASYWTIVNNALRENPPGVADNRVMAFYRDIEVGPDGDVSRLSPAMQKGMASAATRGLITVKNVSQSDYQAKLVNGWKYLPKALGRAGTEGEFLLRASFQSLGGIVANDPEEAVYIVATHDGYGEKLNGRNRYRLSFSKDNLPDTKAFWSVTMYDRTNNLTPNDIDRYSLGDRTVQYDDDGGLTIYISHQPPADENMSNWLPTPAGEFYAILRAYLPSRAIVDQVWEPSPLEKY